MGRINVLGFDIANLIAAGEVVDRPSSVVKELMENALDSGARNITVEIKSGGTTLIRVTDDGCGIEYDDLPVAVLRHATSKISTADDLAQIMTLGFRGEALAAIASVTKLRIISKPAHAEYGGRLTVDCGEIVDLSETGCPNGTTVIAEELFSNVPARRKFLKKDSTETAAVTAVVEKIALSSPSISIRYIADGETKFHTPGNSDLAGVIYVIFGREIASRIRPVKRTDGGITVEGFISEPDFFRPNRTLQNFFINHRYVKSRTMAAALEQAYATRIPPDKFAFCVIDLTINPEAVDVNVHPSKLEVKFTNERIIFDAVYYAVLTSLEEAGSRPELSLGARYSERKIEAPPTPEVKNPDNKSFWVTGDEARKLANSFAAEGQTKSREIKMTDSAPFIPRTEDTPAKSTAPVTSPAPKTPATVPTPARKTVVTAGKKVIIAPERDEGTVYDENGDELAWLPFGEGSGGKPIYKRVKDIPHLTEESTSELLELSKYCLANRSNEGEEDEPCGEEDPAEAGQNGLPEADTPADTPTAVSAPEQFPDTAPIPDVPDESAPQVPEYRILGEAYNCYIIVQLEDRLVLIDKHAAHERIIFDSLCENVKKKNKGAQTLMFPINVPLDDTEIDTLREFEDKIRAIGFIFDFVPKGVELTAIPEEISRESAADMIVSLASSLSENVGSIESVGAEYFDARLYQASCKAAIKGGRVYSLENLRWICDRILRTPAPGESAIKTCPHGRPVAFEIKKNSIERQFQRLV